MADITLTSPLIGEYPITQAFGAHSQPSTDPDDQKLYELYKSLGLSGHNGIDYGAPIGTPIYAPANGVVKKAGWDDKGFGYRITIEHSNGWKTLYGHLSAICCTVGQEVKTGKMIVRVGSTGESTGPHLHFGVYHNEVAVDPALYFVAEDATNSTQSNTNETWPTFPKLPQARVISDELTVRADPSKAALVAGKLVKGEEVSVIGMTEDIAGNPWLRIGWHQWCAYRYASEGQLMEWL